MAITAVWGTVVTGAVGATNVTIPANTTSDILVAVGFKTGAASSSMGINTAGWTVAIDQPNASGDTHILIAYRIGDGGTTVQFASMGGNNGIVAGVLSGGDTASPVIGSDHTSFTGVGSTAPSVGSTTTDDYAVSVLGITNAFSGLSVSGGSLTTLHTDTVAGAIARGAAAATTTTATWSWTGNETGRAGSIVFRSAASTAVRRRGWATAYNRRGR